MNVSFKVNESDLRELDNQIKRLAEVPGKSMKTAVKVGTIKCCQSLRASTKLSAQKHKVLLPKDKKRKDFRKEGKRYFDVIKYRKGKQKIYTVLANSKQEVLASKFATVRRRGTAQVMWMLALKKLYGTNIPPKNFKPPVRALYTRKIERQYEAGIQIINSLNYATEAFRGKGDSDVRNAVKNAGTSVRKTVERELEKAILKFRAG